MSRKMGWERRDGGGGGSGGKCVCVCVWGGGGGGPLEALPRHTRNHDIAG